MCGVQIHNTPNKYTWQRPNDLMSLTVVVFQLRSACRESYNRITRGSMLRSRDELTTSLLHTCHGLVLCYRWCMNKFSKMKVHWWTYNHCLFVSYLTSAAFGYGWTSDTKFQKFSDKDWIWILKKLSDVDQELENQYPLTFERCDRIRRAGVDLGRVLRFSFGFGPAVKNLGKIGHGSGSLFNFGSSRNLCDHLLSKNMGKLGLDRWL